MRSATTACSRSSTRRGRTRHRCSTSTRFPRTEKSRRLQILQEHQRELQRASYGRHLGQILEVMVEGANAARGQMIGRTSQNKTLNFVTNGGSEPRAGDYVQVEVTQIFPNSLLGKMVVGAGDKIQKDIALRT